MKKIFSVVSGIVALTFVPTIALAQPVAQSVAQPSEYNIKVSPVNMQKIADALANLKYGEVADLIQSLRIQIMDQQQKAMHPPVENKMGNVTNNKGIVTQDNKPVEENKENAPSTPKP